MSFFDMFRASSGGPAVSEKWQRLASTEEADTLFAQTGRPVLIYKHSFACSICTFSMLSLERNLAEIEEAADVYFVDVRAERSISNYIAQKSGVTHQSPQAILLYKGHPYWHGSHSEVRAEYVMDALKELH